MIIELENIFITNNAYRGVTTNGRNILKDVNLEISEGELVYLIGKVGSGKSTLMKALYGEIPICKGDAHVVGFNLRTMKRNMIPFMRRRMGIVLSSYELLPDRNIYENMKYVLTATSDMPPKVIHNRIFEVLDLTDLTNKYNRMPYELSSGEQQRATIARAVLNYPKLIIADEPTANLDSKTSSEIMDIFIELSKMGSAVLISTHNLSIIEQSPSRTLKCEKGRIEEIDIYNILGLKQQDKEDTYEQYTHEEYEQGIEYKTEYGQYIHDEYEQKIDDKIIYEQYIHDEYEQKIDDEIIYEQNTHENHEQNIDVNAKYEQNTHEDHEQNIDVNAKYEQDTHKEYE